MARNFYEFILKFSKLRFCLSMTNWQLSIDFMEFYFVMQLTFCVLAQQNCFLTAWNFSYWVLKRKGLKGSRCRTNYRAISKFQNQLVGNNSWKRSQFILKFTSGKSMNRYQMLQDCQLNEIISPTFYNHLGISLLWTYLGDKSCIRVLI